MIVIRVRHTCISEVKEISLKKRQSSPLRVAPFPKKEKDACLCFYSMTEHKKRFFSPRVHYRKTRRRHHNPPSIRMSPFENDSSDDYNEEQERYCE